MECKPYYVLILSLVCAGSALLSLISLASLAPVEIGVQPKGELFLLQRHLALIINCPVLKDTHASPAIPRRKAVP